MQLVEALAKALWIFFSHAWPMLLLMVALWIAKKIVERANRLRR